jgi:4-hydroxy-tetrahydrodipicolinate synthase
VKELIGRFSESDREGAKTIEAEIRPVIEALAVTTNPIPVKAALNMLGHDVGGLRLPLVEATEDEKTAVRAGLERAGVLTAARA